MCIEDIFDVPASDLENLSNFFTDKIKAKCLTGNGLGCVTSEPHALCTRLMVRKDGEDYFLIAEWDDMIRRCELKMRAVLSLWGYYEGGCPGSRWGTVPSSDGLHRGGGPVHQNKCLGPRALCIAVMLCVRL